MGGGGDTAKTLDEIKADLRGQLEANARNQLKELGGSPGDKDDLKKTVPQITERYFKNTYGYDYKVKPPGDDSTEILGRRAPELCDIVPPASRQVWGYLKTEVFSTIQLPEWIEDTAINDLYNLVYRIVSGNSTNKQWIHSNYSREYDVTEGEARSVKCDSSLVYIYGSLLEDGTRAEIAFICFCGVYYTVDSPTVKARRIIETSAYKAAPPMLINPPRQPQDDGELQKSLDNAAKKLFLSDFGYPYGGDPPYPPDSYRRKVQGAFLAHNSILHYIPDPKPGDNLSYYIDRLHYGLNIPLKSIDDMVRQNAAQQYDAIIRTSRGGDRSWVTDRLDRTYDFSAVELNPVRQTGILKSWYGSETLGSGETLSILYIYVMTMVYELEDAFQAQTRDLFGILGNQLRRQIEQDPGPVDVDFLTLKEWATEFSMKNFKKRFEFEFKGRQSQPPYKKPNGPVLSFSSFFQLNTYPVTEKEVDNWMEYEVLPANSPVFARDLIREGIRNDVVKYSNESGVGVNLWYTGGTPNSARYYPDNEGMNRDMQVYVYYLYVHGKLHLASNPTATERVLVFALGVITSYDTSTDPWKSGLRASAPAGMQALSLATTPSTAVKKPERTLPWRVSA